MTPAKVHSKLLRKIYTFVGISILLQLIILPTPAEMSDFMIGCSIGNFRPSSTCEAVCRLLHNRTSCCYGVNYDSRAVCACCDRNSQGKCPTVCNGHCQIITLNAGNCSELRGTKHRSGAGGEGGGPSIINDLSILSDHPLEPGVILPGGGLRKTLKSPRTELDELEGNSTSSSGPSSSSSSKNKTMYSSTSNKLFHRLSSSLDLFN